MKAAVLETLNAPLALAEVDPLPPEYGQVLVRVLSAGFGRWDVLETVRKVYAIY